MQKIKVFFPADVSCRGPNRHLGSKLIIHKNEVYKDSKMFAIGGFENHGQLVCTNHYFVHK